MSRFIRDQFWYKSVWPVLASFYKFTYSMQNSVVDFQCPRCRDWFVREMKFCGYFYLFLIFFEFFPIRDISYYYRWTRICKKLIQSRWKEFPWIGLQEREEKSWAIKLFHPITFLPQSRVLFIMMKRIPKNKWLDGWKMLWELFDYDC